MGAGCVILRIVSCYRYIVFLVGGGGGVSMYLVLPLGEMMGRGGKGSEREWSVEGGLFVFFRSL